MHISSRGLRKILLGTMAGVLALAASGVSVSLVAAADDPGTIPAGGVATNNDPLSVKVTENGKIYLSTDGLGTNDPAGGDIRAQKPSAGATVRSAYLFAASTGFSRHTVVNGDVTLGGQVVMWDSVIPSDIGSSNGWANVTSIVKPTLDAAPVGITSFHVLEQSTLQMDGEGLAVIWDDPAQTADNTIVLMFGAQNPSGPESLWGQLQGAVRVSDRQDQSKPGPRHVAWHFFWIPATSAGLQPSVQHHRRQRDEDVELGRRSRRWPVSEWCADDSRRYRG